MMQELVGTKEDFLLTSFASQGEMNNFIKQKSTFRKSVLANFLDLDIFDKICDMAKNESLPIKALIDRMPSRDWSVLIEEKKNLLEDLRSKREALDEDIGRSKSKIDQLSKKSSELGFDKIVTKEDVQALESEIKQLESGVVSLEEKKLELDAEILAGNDKLTKISAIKSQFPIDELKAKFAEQNQLEKSILKTEHELEREKLELTNQQRSVKLLEQVPCGDSFPTCKFIKDSHKNKQSLPEQITRCEELSSNLSSIRKSLKKMSEENYGEKIEKYQKVLDQESKIKVSIANAENSLGRTTRDHDSKFSLLTEKKERLLVMKENAVDAEDSEVNELKTELRRLGDELKEADRGRLDVSEKIGLASSNITQLEKERNDYQKLISDWNVYETIITATNKRGIPLQVLTNELPKINSEISKILQGVVGFTVELEADHQSNAMDVFINYGDSRRIIECASGMEKMMASLAIRVALINVSSLPKSDLLIIDEGFGALDEMNVESCNRMLQSLKRWFRIIFVISHVDAVKDAVDNFVEITSNGKDSRVYYE
jgi:exonuclease SbcC